MLQAIALECSRGERTLFSGLEFTLEAGTLLRVAGPNGSGKTTLLRTLCGLALPAHGEVRWNGEPIRKLHEEYSRQLVYLGHANGVKDDLNARENLSFACAMGGIGAGRKEVDAALAEAGLSDCGELPARALSQGQRRRVALARLAVASAVPLWILDEPFTALDTGAVARVQDSIAGHLERGGIVVLTSHQEAAISRANLVVIDLGV